MLSGISLPHIFLMLLIVVMIFGTSKLKNVGKDLGGAIKGFKESMRSGESDSEGAAPVANRAQPVLPPTSPSEPVSTQSPTSAQPQNTSSNEPRQGQ